MNRYSNTGGEDLARGKGSSTTILIGCHARYHVTECAAPTLLDCLAAAANATYD